MGTGWAAGVEAIRIGAASCTQSWYQPGNVAHEECGTISLLACFLEWRIMLAKLTVKNQLTLPKAVVTKFTGVEYFEVSTDGTAILLKPFRPSRLDEVRAKLEQLGITEQDVTDAIAWARQSE
jgi:hypothetical protein